MICCHCCGHLCYAFPGMAPEVWRRLLATNGWNEVELRDSRYNQVIHMVSIAACKTPMTRKNLADTRFELLPIYSAILVKCIRGVLVMPL